ncbi:MAG TPA: GNAT family N-acetyltransferase [Acidimicrobiia bacterium]
MPELPAMRYRRARVSDAEAIAALHADSWRRNYRGAYSDAFLDGDVFSDRLTVWTTRLRDRQVKERTTVAETDEGLAGFVHTVSGADAEWGTLLDNLHVTHDLKRAGIGTQLVARAAQALVVENGSEGLFLWVLEQNTAGQAFYQRLGGTCVERDLVNPPGGKPERLAGNPACLRYAWPEPSELLRWLDQRP